MFGWSRCGDQGKRWPRHALIAQPVTSVVPRHLPSTSLVVWAFLGLLSHRYTGLKVFSLLGLLQLERCTGIYLDPGQKAINISPGVLLSLLESTMCVLDQSCCPQHLLNRQMTKIA